MLFYLRLMVAVNVESVLAPVVVRDFIFWLVIFFGIVLSWKLQIELEGFTDRERF